MFDTLKIELSGKSQIQTPAVSYLVKTEKKKYCFPYAFRKKVGKKILLEDYLNHSAKGNRIKLPLRSMARILVLAKKNLNWGRKGHI